MILAWSALFVPIGAFSDEVKGCHLMWFWVKNEKSTYFNITVTNLDTDITKILGCNELIQDYTIAISSR